MPNKHFKFMREMTESPIVLFLLCFLFLTQSKIIVNQFDKQLKSSRNKKPVIKYTKETFLSINFLAPFKLKLNFFIFHLSLLKIYRLGCFYEDIFILVLDIYWKNLHNAHGAVRQQRFYELQKQFDI